MYTLKLLKSKFKDVYFCPGNHELWTKYQKADEELQIDNSIEKFHYVGNDDRIVIVIRILFHFLRY
jgi:hypothetical protein